MWTGLYELVIIWDTGKKHIYEYCNQESAEHAGAGFKKAFGNQIQWYCVRKQVTK